MRKNTIKKKLHVKAIVLICFVFFFSNVTWADNEIQIIAGTNTGKILLDKTIYAFTESDTYTGKSAVTDSNGTAFFNQSDFSSGNYKFRLDYLGLQFWSDVVTIPDILDIAITVQETTVPVNISTGSGPIESVIVYLFSSTGTYLGLNQTTGSDGLVSFSLPLDMTVKFRTDYIGYQFWSDDVTVLESTDAFITIPHQGVTVTVEGNYQTLEPIVGIPVYLFSDAGSYMNQNQTTDPSGQVTFTLPEMAYKFRADYQTQQFWSGSTTWQDETITIPIAQAEITVSGSGLPLEGVGVYAFTASGTYLNLNDATDSTGNVTFRLASGDYKFRADYQSSQYWSEENPLTAYQSNPVSINTGGGVLTFTVLKGASAPLTGVKCYVFNEAGSYLNLNATTDSNGTVSFNLADGNYKIRVDYLGYQFWSEVYALSADLTGELTIPHQDVTVTVEGNYQTSEPIAGIPVFLFSDAGSYMNQNQTTDPSGQVTFTLPEMAYKFRADYQTQQFWSGSTTWQDETITIPIAQAEITVTCSGLPLEGVGVYAFTAAGTYLNLNDATDSTGNVTFRLASGDYKFRADYQSSQYWSEENPLTAYQSNPVFINTGGGVLTFTVLKGASAPLTGVKCYVFNEAGSYLNLNATTDSNGTVSFNLADGSYKIRVDYLGYQFWSEVYALSADLIGELTIPHQDVTITVEGDYPTTEPISGIPVYLFSEAGSYMSQNQTINTSGQVTFNLPEQAYRVRADYLAQQFWSDVFTWQNATITINQGIAEIHVTRSGNNVEGARVYLFSESSSYLSRNKDTDSSGKAQFILPNRIYKFRVDESGEQVWSPNILINAGVVNNVGISLSSMDTDSDGIDDNDETGIYDTDPNSADTDSDGINDGDELAYWGSNWNTDYDGDGLNNLLDDDADNDGMPDGWEIQYGLYPATNDADTDSDGDGLSNKNEYKLNSLPNDEGSLAKIKVQYEYDEKGQVEGSTAIIQTDSVEPIIVPR